MKNKALLAQKGAMLAAGLTALGFGYLANGVLSLTGATADQMSEAYTGIAQGGLDIFAFLVNAAQDLIVLGFAITFGLLFLFHR